METNAGRLQSGKAIRLAPLGNENMRGEGGRNLLRWLYNQVVLLPTRSYSTVVATLLSRQTYGLHLDLKP